MLIEQGKIKMIEFIESDREWLEYLQRVKHFINSI